METAHIIWLALVQGLTEFLPVSSSAHLILVPNLLGWPDQGTIPAGIGGLLFKDYIEVYLRSPLVIATTTIIFGLLLWFADKRAKLKRDELSLSWQDFLVIGGAQAMALIPGTSRSGITITAGLLLGLTREAAARYSFLLSIPIIVLSGLGVTGDLVSSSDPVDWTALLLGTVIAAISAFACIHFFLAWINRIGMLPFVIYRLLLGAFLFFVFLT